jgi:hypothetical protein
VVSGIAEKDKKQKKLEKAITLLAFARVKLETV